MKISHWIADMITGGELSRAKEAEEYANRHMVQGYYGLRDAVDRLRAERGALGIEKPKCGCRTCIDATPNHPQRGFFIACPKCGNKRCPKATDHRLDCTNSNEPGQAGSAYA